jgi:hypothetical protein
LSTISSLPVLVLADRLYSQPDQAVIPQVAVALVPLSAYDELATVCPSAMSPFDLTRINEARAR